MSGLREHRHFERARRVYLNAVKDWHASDAIQRAAAVLGMNAREYADSRIASNQAAGPADFTRAHLDLAYRDAVNEACGAEGRVSP